MADDKGRVELFTFGDPEPVLEARDIMNYLQSWWTGRWYEPPISWEGLAKSFRANPHHSSAIYLKRNILVSTFVPHRLLSKQGFAKLALDFLTFGNAYLERRDSRTKRAVTLDHALAKYMRRGREPEQYYFVQQAIGLEQAEHAFKPGSIWHLVEPDINQEIYGLPEYLSALQSAWLNESATLFRRKYYKNGSHAGFILYMTDAEVNDEDVTALRQALKDAKGPGNFRNLFLHSPNGKKDGIQLIPVAEVAAKDEFFNIKNVTRDDVLAGHRVPPQIMGLIPSNTAGFGAADIATKVFATNEIAPLQARFLELNDWMGEEVVRFEAYEVAGIDTGKGMGTGA